MKTYWHRHIIWLLVSMHDSLVIMFKESIVLDKIFSQNKYFTICNWWPFWRYLSDILYHFHMKPFLLTDVNYLVNLFINLAGLCYVLLQSVIHLRGLDVLLLTSWKIYLGNFYLLYYLDLLLNKFIHLHFLIEQTSFKFRPPELICLIN